MLSCLARLPFLDRNPPCQASFSSYKLLFCSPSQNSSRSRRDNQRTRERGCQRTCRAKGSKLFSHIKVHLKFAGRVILPRGTASLHIKGAFIKLHLIRHSQIVWQGCKGKREGDSIGAKKREGRARKEAREHMRGRYFFPRSFLLYYAQILSLTVAQETRIKLRHTPSIRFVETGAPDSNQCNTFFNIGRLQIAL